MFHLEIFLFVLLFPPSKFSMLIDFLNSIVMGIFIRFLGLDSLKCPNPLFVHQHVALPISSGGTRLISSKVIALVACLGSWALVAFVIISRFLSDFCSFLLEVIGVSNLRPFPFQAHLKLA